MTGLTRWIEQAPAGAAGAAGVAGTAGPPAPSPASLALTTPILNPTRAPGALPIGLAGAALLLGLAVYLVDRPVAPSLRVPGIGAFARPGAFGAVGGWLPSFVHPFAFALLTAALLPVRSRARFGACAAWGAVNVAFEIGQHPRLRGALASAIGQAFGPAPAARALANYFMRGTFDPLDITAALAGAAAAAGVLWLARRRAETPHA
jgi:hypothetical protein